jgi:O-antigen/teichoic acid export membrane protein
MTMRVGGKSLTETLRGLPVVGSAASLMVGTVATSLLGLPFWILAAQLYSGAALGVASTGVNLTMILAEVACVGLRSGLARYVPRAEGAAPKTILFSYVVGTSLAAVALGVFLLGFPIWGSNLDAMRSSPGIVLYVILAGACWALFMLQDSVLVALGKSVWVPIENTIFGLVKLALLFPFASWSPEFGIYWAWTLPVVPLVLIVNFLIARELLWASEAEADADAESAPTEPTAHDESAQAETAIPLVDPVDENTLDVTALSIDGVAPSDGTAASGRLGFQPSRSFLTELVQFSLADWRSSLARLAGIVIISLLVIDRLGQVASGYFQIAWTMAYALFSLSATAAFALLVDRRGDRQTLSRNSLQVGALCLAVTGLASLIGVLAAPLILRLFGPAFPENASTLMRLLFLAALPNVVFQMYLGYLRTQGRMRKLIVVETVVSGIAVLLTAALIGSLGINGVGWAWLASVLAASVYASLSESVWWWAGWFNTGTVRRAGTVARRLRVTGPSGRQSDAAGALSTLAGPSAGRAVWHSPSPGISTAVISAGDEPMETVYAFADGPDGPQELEAEQACVEAVRFLDVRTSLADGRSIVLGELLPTVIERGRTQAASGADMAYTIWRRPTGPNAAELIEQGWSPAAVADAVLPIVQAVHAATAQTLIVDAELLEGWVEPGLTRLALVDTVTDDAAEAVRAVLRADLLDQPVQVGMIHGRLTPNNLILGGDPGVVAGLRGWRGSDVARPQFLDQAILAVAEMARQRHVEAGQLLRELLLDPTPLAEHPGSPLQADNTIPPRSVILLTWLYILDFPHHERASVAPEFVWMARNARPVLDAVAELGTDEAADAAVLTS